MNQVEELLEQTLKEIPEGRFGRIPGEFYRANSMDILHVSVKGYKL